jgi:predicted Zn-dependent protease
MISLKRKHLPFLLIFALLVFCSASVTQAGLETKIEQGLGRQVAKMLEEETGVVDSPLLVSWVSDLGSRLAAVAGRDDVKYTFKILDSEDINAAAVPGGHIYVTKGLLRFIESEDELAGVLGHEIGHIAAKHSNKQIKAQILGSLVLSTLKSDKLERIASGAQLAGLFALLKFSRDHEIEADELGLEFSSKLGYDGRHVLSFFQRLDERQKDKPSRFESYFLTHPSMKDRQERLTGRPELEPSAANALRRAENLRNRGLITQSEAAYREALAAEPELAAAKEALERKIGEDAVFHPAPMQPMSETGEDFSGNYNDAKEAVEARLITLEKHQARLEKQVKAIYSNLRFAGRFVSAYDVVRAREFYTAVEAADNVAKTASRLATSRRSAEEALKELSSLEKKLADEDAPRDIAFRFRRESVVAMGAMAEVLGAAETVAGTTERSARTVDFAVRQLTSSLMMPAPTSLGMSGMIGLQLSGVRKAIQSGLIESRKLSGEVEKQRTVGLETRIDLQMSYAKPRHVYAFERLVAGYFSASVDEVRSSAKRFGRFGGAALAVAKSKFEVAETESQDGEVRPEQYSAVDYDSINIMLGIISRDIEREKAAAAG